MEPHEQSVVIPAQPEIVQIEQQIEKEIVQIENTIARSRTVARLQELSAFATAMIVTTAGVFLAGVLGIVFSVGFVVAAPLLLLGIVFATARSVQRRRAEAN